MDHHLLFKFCLTKEISAKKIAGPDQRGKSRPTDSTCGGEFVRRSRHRRRCYWARYRRAAYRHAAFQTPNKLSESNWEVSKSWDLHICDMFKLCNE